VASLTGAGARDLYRVCQIADVLDVSVDWLTGRSNVMNVTEMPELELELPEPPKIRYRNSDIATVWSACSSAVPKKKPLI
jgi:hypothetical protein